MGFVFPAKMFVKSGFCPKKIEEGLQYDKN